eukprot:TRINITY_DN6749_c0_g1_i5.p3 TRINITY_DN6749_c0_g1~~TRINITY_DN6749_c0_g1_i5.p3  ORF type:complete len:120 (+),score=11.30 TRINITY_DN6749_c0_g1_i5:195-554(+)
MKTAQNMLVVSALVVALSFSQPAKAATSEAEVIQGLASYWGLALGTDVCNATWVTCSTDGDVTRLDLSGNSLTGSIPESLGSLTKLTFLDLGSNKLTGSIPNSLGALSNLLSNLQSLWL